MKNEVIAKCEPVITIKCIKPETKFSGSEEDLSGTDIVQHRINTVNNQPIRQPARRPSSR